MARLVDNNTQAQPAAATGTRGRLLELYRDRFERARQPVLMAGQIVAYPRAVSALEAMVRDLQAGRAVVVPQWVLRQVGYPVLPGRRHYRVGRNGAAVEVTPRRDPADPMVIVDWLEVPQ